MNQEHFDLLRKARSAKEEDRYELQAFVSALSNLARIYREEPAEFPKFLNGHNIPWPIVLEVFRLIVQGVDPHQVEKLILQRCQESVGIPRELLRGLLLKAFVSILLKRKPMRSFLILTDSLLREPYTHRTFNGRRMTLEEEKALLAAMDTPSGRPAGSA